MPRAVVEAGLRHVKARRSPDPAVHEIRIHHQPEDSKGARPGDSAEPARVRRRDDRI